MPANGFSSKPLNVKILAGEKKATETTKQAKQANKQPDERTNKQASKQTNKNKQSNNGLTLPRGAGASAKRPHPALAAGARRRAALNMGGSVKVSETHQVVC